MNKKFLAVVGFTAAISLTGCGLHAKVEPGPPEQTLNESKTEKKEETKEVTATPKTDTKIKETANFTFQTNSPEAWKKYNRGAVEAWQRENGKGSYLNVTVVSVHDIVKSGAGWEGLTDLAIKQTLMDQGAFDVQLTHTGDTGRKNITANYLLSGGIECTQTYVQLKDSKVAIVAFTHPTEAKHEFGSDTLEPELETVVKTVELK